MHFLPGDARRWEQVKAFDAEGLARQVAELGAGHFVITPGQNSGYCIPPNATYDRITGYAAGKRCSPRELPLDFWRALEAEGICKRARCVVPRLVEDLRGYTPALGPRVGPGGAPAKIGSNGCTDP